MTLETTETDGYATMTPDQVLQALLDQEHKDLSGDEDELKQAEERIVSLRDTIKKRRTTIRAYSVGLQIARARKPKAEPEPEKKGRGRPRGSKNKAAPAEQKTEDVPTYPEGAEVRCPRKEPFPCDWTGLKVNLVADHCPECGSSVVPIIREA